LITETHHFSFTVSNMEESLHFFCDQLGLKRPDILEFQGNIVETILGIPDVRLRASYVETPGNMRIELIEYLNPTGHSIDLATCNPGVGHVCFVVEGLDEMYANLSVQGVTFVSPPVWWEGVDAEGKACASGSCYLRGPDGISVELSENKAA